MPDKISILQQKVLETFEVQLLNISGLFENVKIYLFYKLDYLFF